MLDAIYPVELSWISGEEFGVYNWDYRIDVTVVPKESSYSNPDEQVRILKVRNLPYLRRGSDRRRCGIKLSAKSNLSGEWRMRMKFKDMPYKGSIMTKQRSSLKL